ncbi:MAG: peroxidase-related enzyme [Thioalkalivibrio sp.]|jgi:uncharacterized peroxidase-related enzyme|nr:peroxidase-related enzyme [Thioalkalivibrio sp.]
MAFLSRLRKGDKVPHALAAFDTGTGRPLVELHEALMRGDSPLSVRDRETLAAFVSGVNACDYCQGAHAAAAAQFGMDPSFLESLVTDPDLGAAADEWQPVFAYARKLTLQPARIVQADVDAMLQVGWSERAVYDVMQITALYNFMNRFANGLGLDVVPDDFELEGAMLARGYRDLIDAFELR